MRSRSTRIAAALLLLALSPCARAGTQHYVWGVYGSGYYLPDPGGTLQPFSADATLAMAYDPDDPANDRLSLEIGMPGAGLGIDIGSLRTFTVGPDYIFAAGTSNEGMLNVSLSGVVGPLNAAGSPLTLAGLDLVGGGADGGLTSQLEYYTFSSAPEPSSLVLMALGIAIASAAVGRRR
jgi:hypothetical protein